MNETFVYRIGGGPDRRYWVVVTLDELPVWTTLLQIKHLANHGRPGLKHWILRSNGKAMVCKTFGRALDVQNEWAKQLEPREQIAIGRLAPHELIVAMLEEGRC